jgi:prepilin-type N-terminal cleavage/methylation domain-containing protein/prepilin-type processing-associated H-X9-DG protein
MKKKGFTLVELLVVIAIIALLMGILMPALARVRTIAYRMVCGTNLSGIGKAILLYAGDAREEYPMPGITKNCSWATLGKVNEWSDRYQKGPSAATQGVYSSTINAAGGEGTIGSVFYLLVKYEDTSVKQFNCKGDVGVKVFKLTDSTFASSSMDDFTKAWDFGNRPGNYCSYSYHNPFTPPAGSPTGGQGYPVNSNSPPAAPLAADRNPTLDKNVTYIKAQAQGGQLPTGTDTAIQLPLTRWPLASPPSYQDPDYLFNSFAHQREGQNVLFNDGHVRFEKTANVGIDNDNIWQAWPTIAPLAPVADAKRQREVYGYFCNAGFPPGPGGKSYSSGTELGTYPMGNGDSLLVNENQNAGNDSW